MDVIDVVPHLRDRDTAMGLLRRTKAPFAAHCSRPLREGVGYRFTTEDVCEFVSTRRPDLAALILEGTSDENMLYDMSRMDVPVPVLKAVCRNRNAPTELLAYLSCDARKGVFAGARSALAQRMDSQIAVCERNIEQIRALVFCPDEELTEVLGSAVKGWSLSMTNFAIETVLERTTPVPDSAWALISKLVWDDPGSAWSWVVHYGSNRVLELLAEDPRMTVDDLESILGRLRYSGPKGVVRDALMDRLVPGSDRWLELLADYSASDLSPMYAKHGKYVSHLSADQARALLKSCGAGTLLALDSGKVPDEEIIEWARDWLRSPVTTYFASRVMAHPAICGDLLEQFMAKADAAPSFLSSLAANRGLTLPMQRRIVRDESARRVLAANPVLLPESAEELVAAAMDDPMRSRGQATPSGNVPWRAQAPLYALLANGALDAEVRLSVPAAVLVKPRHEVFLVVGPVVAFIDEQIGYDVDRWQAFLGLLNEWEGSLHDLVRVVVFL